ncbi:hypothetical protein GW17_00037942 [Ensete ventricosum]|nr:hypothetical protein GW17_00037942 [Ensete ventricosum]
MAGPGAGSGTARAKRREKNREVGPGAGSGTARARESKVVEEHETIQRKVRKRRGNGAAGGEERVKGYGLCGVDGGDGEDDGGGREEGEGEEEEVVGELVEEEEEPFGDGYGRRQRRRGGKQGARMMRAKVRGAPSGIATGSRNMSATDRACSSSSRRSIPSFPAGSSFTPALSLRLG